MIFVSYSCASVCQEMQHKQLCCFHDGPNALTMFAVAAAGPDHKAAGARPSEAAGQSGRRRGDQGAPLLLGDQLGAAAQHPPALRAPPQPPQPQGPALGRRPGALRRLLGLLGASQGAKQPSVPGLASLHG